jgi:hypothetical protein
MRNSEIARMSCKCCSLAESCCKATHFSKAFKFVQRGVERYQRKIIVRGGLELQSGSKIEGLEGFQVVTKKR